MTRFNKPYPGPMTPEEYRAQRLAQYSPFDMQTRNNESLSGLQQDAMTPPLRNSMEGINDEMSVGLQEDAMAPSLYDGMGSSNSDLMGSLNQDAMVPYSPPTMQSSAGNRGAGQTQPTYSQSFNPTDYFPMRQSMEGLDGPPPPPPTMQSSAPDLPNWRDDIDSDLMSSLQEDAMAPYSPPDLPSKAGGVASSLGDATATSGNPYLMAAGGAAKIFGAYQDGKRQDKMDKEEQRRFERSEGIGRRQAIQGMEQGRESHEATMKNNERNIRNQAQDRYLKMASYKGRH
mgnify:FL=1